jgi:hypothetical protein
MDGQHHCYAILYISLQTNSLTFVSVRPIEIVFSGLKLGEITPQHLVQQLQNPAMQHRHREVLVSILKLQLQPGKMYSYWLFSFCNSILFAMCTSTFSKLCKTIYSGM